MSRILLFLLFAATGPLIAGSAEALIQGKTESGRTHFELLVGDIEGSIRSVKLTIDGESYTIEEADSSPQTVIRDPRNGVYFLTLEKGDRVFRLWMIPHSEKTLEQGQGVYRSRFAAVLEATDPRKGKEGALTPRITIGCTLDWEI